jgi:hypothetical protein
MVICQAAQPKQLEQTFCAPVDSDMEAAQMRQLALRKEASMGMRA